ncbi:MAG TPA: tetratricopeptide repeat protein [Anaerolineales bacterium]
MENIKTFIDDLEGKYLSSTYQIQRIIILLGIVLALAVASFGGYYYYDRYYRPQPKVAEMGIAQAEQALRDKPDDPEVRLNLAETYMANRRFDSALEQATTVMGAYPDNQRSWFLVGVANALKGNYSDATGPLEKYVDANQKSDMPGLNKPLQAAAFYLGESYLQLNQADKAVPVLEMVVKWNQTDADSMYKLGMAYIGIQKYQDAVSMFQSATTFVPDYTEAYEGMAASFDALKEPEYADYARGMVAYSKKDYTTALTLLSKTSKAKADFAPVFDGLGLTYEAMKDLQNAKTSYETSLKLVPADYTAVTGLERVKILLNK